MADGDLGITQGDGIALGIFGNGLSFMNPQFTTI